MSAKFDQFVKEHADALAENSADIAAEKKIWLSKLDQLYGVVKASLSGYLGNGGGIKLDLSSLDIYEEQLGTYTVPFATITVGRQVVKLIPKGTFLIGAAGRVDMTGPRGVVRFVIVARAATEPKFRALDVTAGAELPRDWVWKISSPPPRITKMSAGRRRVFGRWRNWSIQVRWPYCLR